LLFFECGLCSHLEAAKSAETHRSRQKYQKSLITTWKENRRGTHGGGDVHIVEMCFFALSDQNVSICSSTFTSQAPKMLLSTKVPKPIEKTKTTKKQKVSPHAPCPASQTLSMGGNFFLGVLEVFATLSVQQCQLLIFWGFVFLFLGLLGEIFTLTNIHWHSFHPSTFYIDVFIGLLILATGPSEKMYSKNSSISIAHLFRHSIGLMFYWYAEVLVPHL
jgi:hypothetical protein